MAEDFEAVFARLRGLMLKAAPGMVVAKDSAGALELRTPVIDPKTRQHGWFGTVTIKKTYVAYHLMPLYDRPALADGISPALVKRKQGKTCFNFARSDEPLFAELDRLTRACAAAASG
jgi:hypothetical protein